MVAEKRVVLLHFCCLQFSRLHSGRQHDGRQAVNVIDDCNKTKQIGGVSCTFAAVRSLPAGTTDLKFETSLARPVVRPDCVRAQFYGS